MEGEVSAIKVEVIETKCCIPTAFNDAGGGVFPSDCKVETDCKVEIEWTRGGADITEQNTFSSAGIKVELKQEEEYMAPVPNDETNHPPPDLVSRYQLRRLSVRLVDCCTKQEEEEGTNDEDNRDGENHKTETESPPSSMPNSTTIQDATTHTFKIHGSSVNSKSVNATGSLQVQQSINTEEKPYKCGQCSTHFSKSGSLQRHKRIHTGERPYECGQCGKRFSKARNLRQHKRIHTRQRPYERGTNQMLRQSYNAYFKMTVVNEAESSNNSRAAKKYGVTECNVRRWRSQKERLQNASGHRKAFRGPQRGRFHEIDRRVCQYVTEKRQDGMLISRAIIQLKALEIAKELNIPTNEFKVSLGWVKRMIKRNGLSLRQRTSPAQHLASDFEEKLMTFQRVTALQ